MTDLHTHILPGMDDGSKSVEESVSLLDMEQAQGVDWVALTPHFYRANESSQEFLERRQRSLEQLLPHLPQGGPKLVLGAEVAWFPSIAQYGSLERLSLGDSGFFLLELPWDPWPTRLLDQLYELSCVSGMTPILAHVERYLPLQSRSQMSELLSMGLPMQMNANFLLGPLTRHKALSLLEQGEWHMGSDSHNIARRPPNLGQAAELLKKKRPGHDLDTLLSWRPEKEVEA